MPFINELCNHYSWIAYGLSNALLYFAQFPLLHIKLVLPPVPWPKPQGLQNKKNYQQDFKILRFS